MTPTLMTILEFPDARLRTKAAPIKDVTDAIATLADRMLATMYEAPGIGLAATQVNVHQRLLVCDVSEDKSAPLVLINPKIVEGHGSTETQEGCLSVPGFYETVVRPEQILVEAVNRAGEPFQLEADGLLAVCIQHEIDHLDGKLFVDYLSPTKRQMIRKKLLKLQKLNA
jgi:peptide deformylase